MNMGQKRVLSIGSLIYVKINIIMWDLVRFGSMFSFIIYINFFYFLLIKN